ncbi:MAG: hypothetical protein C0467_14260 [Planctomycetaceae bacterium]|nr:hypothetical protein [Planctomycetaceae bacterium]
MSRRTVTRLTLAGLLTAALAAPTLADDTAVAPMPRAVSKSFAWLPEFKIEVEFSFSSDDANVSRERPVRVASTKPPCCAFDCSGTTLAVAPMPRVAERRIDIPALGPIGLALEFNVPLNKSPSDHKQLVNISVGVFGEQDDCHVAPMPRPVATNRDRIKQYYGSRSVQVMSPDTEPRGHNQLVELSFEIFDVEDRIPTLPCLPMPPSLAIQRCEGVMTQPAMPSCCTTANRVVTARPTDMRVMYPLVGVTNVRRDETGTWWAEVNGVPQPKQATSTAFAPPPAGCTLVLPPTPPTPPVFQLTCRPAKPANVPAVEFDVIAGVFGEMLDGKKACPTAPCPVQPAGHAVPLNAPMLIQPVRTPVAPPARTGLTGTWVREIGPLVYVVKLAQDHVTITVTSSVELPDGTTYTEGLVLTADYHMTRDGTTLVGLITGVDAVIEGTMPAEPDLPGNGIELSKIEKLLVDKPMAMNLRLYGDVMVVGNVRLPDLESTVGSTYPLTVLGGRYTPLGDKAVPKPKAVKMQVPRDLLPVPLTATPSSYIPVPVTTPAILPTSYTPPPLPQNVPDYLPAIPGLMPAGLNAIPIPVVEKPAPRSVEPTQPKTGKKGKKAAAN